MGDNHRPVLITKNNFGFPTLRIFLISVHSSGRIFNRLERIRFTPDLGLAARLERFTRSHPRFWVVRLYTSQ